MLHILDVGDVMEILDNLSGVLEGKKGLIFDVDGTLLDSMPMWKRLDVEYLSSLGLTPEPDFQNKVKMMTMLDASRYIKKYFGLDKQPEVIAKEIENIAYSYYENELLIKPGSFELLTELKKCGYKMVVATANEYEMCKSALIRNNIMDLFEDLVTCSMVGCSKERPDVYLLACDKMGLSVDECVVFEDSYFAINTAKNAGFSVVGVYDETEEDNWESICKLTDGQVVF